MHETSKGILTSPEGEIEAFASTSKAVATDLAIPRVAVHASQCGGAGA